MKIWKKIFLWLSRRKVLKSLPLEKFLTEKTEPIFDTSYS
jgi:hypothetical protein